MTNTTKTGRRFERAVHRIAQSIAPNADIYFDHKVQDRDTGSKRQVDVWIEGKLESHWPVSALVSCKDHSRRIDIGQIGTFINEVRSTGANIGIIYSSQGFSSNAAQKAAANGVICCRLFENEPAEVPEHLLIRQVFSLPTLSGVLRSNATIPEGVTWGNFLRSPSVLDDDPSSTSSAFEMISETAKDLQNYAIHERRLDEPSYAKIPFSWFGLPFEFVLRIDWRHFLGHVGAHRLDGSYSLQNDDFFGKISGPTIDLATLPADPGDDWKEVEGIPEEANLQTGAVVEFSRTSLDLDQPLQTGELWPVRKA